MHNKKDRWIENRKNQMILAIASLLLVLVSASIYIYMQSPHITGLSIGTVKKNTELLNISTNQSGTYTIGLTTLPPNATITSVRLSGTAAGEGYFKVYMEDGEKRHLIVEKPMEKGGIFHITGLAFSIPVETGDQENTTQQTENPPENGNPSYNMTPNMTNGPDNLTDNLSLNISNLLLNLSDNLTMNFTQNLTLNLSGNLTMNLTDNLSFNLTDNLTLNLSDNLTLNLTENLTLNLSGNLTLPGNLSVNATLNETNQTQNMTMPLFLFQDTCDETCAIVLKKPEFDLRIEIEDVQLNLESVTYTYFAENKTNITELALTAFIPDLHIAPGENKTLNLSTYFGNMTGLEYQYEEA
ncbi:hypothetical protein JW968_02790, partial [Candidatus Woesearchaeota archaeon]|nr:hypothetical protein [Candidatus Woesearchaeota archaeon]